MKGGKFFIVSLFNNGFSTYYMMPNVKKTVTMNSEGCGSDDHHSDELNYPNIFLDEFMYI